MAFVNATFPDIKLKHGITKTVLDPVAITGNGTREVRRRLNQFERFVWNFPARILSEADKQAIFVFLRSVNMGQDSFLFRDPAMPTMTALKLPRDPTTANGNRQLCYPYQAPDGTNLLSDRQKHPIFQTTGLTFDISGLGVTPTVSGIANGFLSLAVPGAGPNSAVNVTGDVKFKVRFEGSPSWTIAAMMLPPGGDCGDVTPTMVELGDFQLVEVFE